MSARIKLLPLALIALLGLFIFACNEDSDPAGDSGADDGVSNAGDGVDDEFFVANAPEVLTRSVESFEATEVTSMTGDVDFEFGMGALAVAGNAEFAAQMPDQMHMTMTFEGGDGQSLVDLSQMGTFEALVRDGTFYINMPVLGGWFSLSPEELGTSFTGVEDLMSQGSIVDYSALIGQMGGQVQYVGDEDVNGRATAHYTVQGDLQSLIASFSSALGATGDNAFAERIIGSQLTGPIALDIWIGKDDFLPYRMTANGSINAGDSGTLVMDLSAEFGHYNEDVDIPAAPAQAKSFSDIMGQLGLDPSQMQQ
jgi:hypothetical protein